MTADTKPNVRHYSKEDIQRLINLVNEAGNIYQEIEDLQGGLNDTIKAVAEEIGVKPAQLKKVAKIAFKNSLGDERAKFEEIEDILTTIGKGGN